MRSISLSLKVREDDYGNSAKGDRDRPATSALGMLDMQVFLLGCPYLRGSFLLETLIMPYL